MNKHFLYHRKPGGMSPTVLHRLAKSASVVFHPLWMPLLIYLSLKAVIPFATLGRQADILVWVLLAVNCVAPAISIFLMKRFGLISSLELGDRRERLVPYAIVIFYYFSAWLLLRWRPVGLSPVTIDLFLTVAVSLVFANLINRWWKISVHMVAQGGFFGVVLAVAHIYGVPVVIWLTIAAIAAVLVGWSRVHLRAHDEWQVYAGWLLGVLINFGVLVYS